MRCSCKACGTYMVQREQGVESACVCPQCFSTCSACISPAGGSPLSKEDLKFALWMRQAQDSISVEEKEERIPMSPEEYRD